MVIRKRCILFMNLHGYPFYDCLITAALQKSLMISIVYYARSFKRKALEISTKKYRISKFSSSDKMHDFMRPLASKKAKAAVRFKVCQLLMLRFRSHVSVPDTCTFLTLLFDSF